MSTLEFTGLDLDFPVGSKNRTATLVNSEQEALPTDAGLTPADGHRLASDLLDSGKPHRRSEAQTVRDHRLRCSRSHPPGRGGPSPVHQEHPCPHAERVTPVTSLPSRRRLLATGAGAALGLGTLGTTASPASATAAHGAGAEETKTLDELYQAAIAEGGKLVIYAGGDLANSGSGAAARTAFRQRFPQIDLNLIVDYSKYHDVRVDNQFATDTLVPDVVQLQTLHDFTRWKRQGRLLHYKPAGFSKLHKKFKDPDGAWVAGMVIAFSYLYDVAAAGADAPQTPLDLVDPRWKGAIASSYPHDDDAVLYLFALYAETYGWDWVADFAAQQPQFARGSFSPGTAVTSKEKIIGVGAGGNPLATSPNRWMMTDGHPFMAWGQRIAILKQAAHPTAAKLYLNWQLSTERQTSNSWSVRTDIAPPTGLKPIWEYPNANVDGFPRFMEDRAQVERLKQTFALYFGEVKGDPTPGWPGLHPGA